MSEAEIALAQAYLAAARQDPVAALIRSVRDLIRFCGPAATLTGSVEEVVRSNGASAEA